MKKKIFIVFGIVILLFAIFAFKKITSLHSFSENNNLKIVNHEPLEVTKEQMLLAIEDLEPQFDIIEKKERIANEDFDCIMMKKTECQFEDIVVEIYAYFEVDKEEKLIYDTLFAWSKPNKDVSDYQQVAITELVVEYPTELATIRVRGIYEGSAKSMDLYYNMK